MKLKSIQLSNFTNYEKAASEFNDNINIFIGENAQGKSNLLDSIYFLSTIHSGRNHRDKELIKWGRDSFELSAHFLNKNGENQVQMKVGNKKEVSINSYKIEKKKEYIGFLTVILFTPEDLYLIKGDPSLRRNYMDNELIQTDVEYYLNLIKYKKILEQRNNLLKKAWKNGISNDMDVWEEQLAQAGAKIVKKRIEFLEQIKPLAKVIHSSITNNVENLDIEYIASLSLDELMKNNNPENFLLYYKKTLKDNRRNDMERGYTTIGPHRDDLELSINSTSVRKYGSQGQQRTAALSLKLSEIEFIKEITGEYPILLLDDVLSELDKKRKNKLLQAIEDKVQTFITTTDINDLDENLKKKGKIIEIREGNIV